MSVNVNTVSPREKLQWRDTIPWDLHWKPDIPFMGEIYHNDSDRYYSSLGGKTYRPKLEVKHLDEGHYQGYRFAIQRLLKGRGKRVLDPTCGSGTAIIEAVNHNHYGVGVELEWPEMAKMNVAHQPNGKQGKIIQGNAADLRKLLKNHKKFDLVMNGPPYPCIGGRKTSDAPETAEQDSYLAEGSFGSMVWGNAYLETIVNMYIDCIDRLRKGGYLVVIIKDPVHRKEPFMLQWSIIDTLLHNDSRVKSHGYFVHRHVPETYFMRTYSKRFPEVSLPWYQLGYVLRKKK